MRKAREAVTPYTGSPRIPEPDCSTWSDAQLLAVFLRSGQPGKPALKAATELLEGHGGLAGVLHALGDQFPPWLTGSRRGAIQAVLEISKRVLAQQLAERAVFGSPDAVKDYLQLHLARKEHEAFAVLFLDAQNRLIELQVMFRGTLTQTSVYPREIVVHALRVGASSVVLAHNHPSGTVQPSRADEALTQTIKAALALVDVRVLDHVIVAPGVALSMAEKGLI
jgi:DNA repair protein RadC